MWMFSRLKLRRFCSMKFISLVGEDTDDSSYINFEIEGGDRGNCIGDQVWISSDGKELMVYIDMSLSILNEVVDMFSTQSDKLAFKGAMRRVGYDY